jgi:hypothetical protein
MQCNVGGVEREVRGALGLALLAAASVSPLPVRWRALLAGLGAVGVATAASQYCPLNSVLGIDTCHPHLPRLRGPAG